MRQYERIWLAIKELPIGGELAVRVHVSAKARLIQAVKLEKTKEVAIKRKLGLPRQGPLCIRVGEDTPKNSRDAVIVYFKLSWDGTKL